MGNSSKSHLAKFEAVFLQYLDVYMTGRNLEKLDEMVSENFIGFGTGIDENIYSKAMGMEIFERDIKSAPNELHYNIHRHEIKLMDQYSAIVVTELDLKTAIANQEVKLNNLRMMLVMHEEAGVIKITGIHISFPTEVHDEGESYPLKELEERNKVLRRMVDEKTKKQQEVIYKLREAEEALRKSEQELKAIIENMTDVVAMADIEGKFTYISESSHNVFGYKPEELIGKSIIELVHEDDILKVQTTFQEGIAEKKKSARIEHRVRSKNGSYIWVEALGNLIINKNGQPSGVLFISRDISERKEAEAALKLQVSERAAVDAFTNSVSNDLLAPLRRIEGFSTALLEECHGQVNDQAREYLARITQQVDSMKVRTEALLKLSRVVSHDINYEEFNLSALARSYLKKLSYIEPARRVETVVAPKVEAKGDVDLLSIVMENLLNNSWKFTAGVEKARIECGSNKQDGKTVYFVRDNGIGFDQQRADKLFEPFQKLHSEADYPGIGIGLNLVYRIISRHGGEIWAEGEPGKGACFYFTLL